MNASFSDRSGSTARQRPKILLPLALALICSSWVMLTHVYLPPHSGALPWVLLSLAFLLLFVRLLICGEGLSIRLFHQPSWATAVGVSASLLLLWLLPYPYNLGAAPLLLGWLGLTLLKRAPLPRYLSGALLQIGLILLITAALLPLYYAWAARVHPLSGPGWFFTPLIAGLLKLLGQPVSLAGGDILLRSFEELYRQTITLEKLLPLPFALFGAVWGGAMILSSERRKLERLLVFLVILALYLALRTALLLLIMMQRVDLAYFWTPLALTLSLLPLSLALREPASEALKLEVREPLSRGKKSQDWFSLALGFIAGGALLAFFTFQDAGVKKAGRLMINEHGSDWEWTTDTLSVEDYNEKTTYNYYCLAEFLKYYYDLERNFEPLTPQILQNVDVLILKTPTQHYQPEELQAIWEFVRRGGGLWVIGDHTNVFGTSQYLNPLLARFGYKLNYTSTHDLQTGNLSLYRKPEVFAHASVVNLPPYLFATSCSMDAPWKGQSAILGYGLRADHLDYSQKNFFADRSRKQFNMQFGLLLQQAGGFCGRGRLLIYTDSTTFSNFFMFIKGKPELALGSLEWLNRRNALSWLNTALLLIGIVALALLTWRRSWNGASLAGLLSGVVIVGFLTDRHTASAYPLPNPERAVPWVNFERQYSDYFLPTLKLGDGKEISYLTFYVWAQRVGAVPREVSDFDSAIAASDPVVMIDVKETLAESEIAALKGYLERGGRLLLLNSADNASSAPMKLLDALGLRLQTVALPKDTAHTLTLAGRSFSLVVNKKFSKFGNGEAFLKSDQGEVIGVEQEVGRGKVWALACGHIFRNTGMGQTSVVPDSGLRALYEIEYNLIRKLRDL